MRGYTMFIPGHMPLSVNLPGYEPFYISVPGVDRNPVTFEIARKPSAEQLRKRAMELAKRDYDNQEVVPFRAKTSLAEYENYYHELLGVSAK